MKKYRITLFLFFAFCFLFIITNKINSKYNNLLDEYNTMQNENLILTKNNEELCDIISKYEYIENLCSDIVYMQN